MTDSLPHRRGYDDLREFFVFGADSELVGTAQEIAKWGPSWRRHDGNTLLHLAASRCELDWIRKLIASGWMPNEPNVRGATPLHLVVLHDSYRNDPATGEKCIEALLEGGAAIDSQDNNGDTPLHVAANWGNVFAARALLDAGASVDRQGGFASTPLDCAVRAGSSEVVELLIRAGANVNHRNESGGTPLIWAATCDPRITRILLSAGADAAIRDNEGESALDGAVSSCPEAAELIRKHLARDHANGQESN